VNEGISGNQLLPNGVAHFSGGPSGLSRLTRDALSQPGAREVVVQLGTNDISWDATHGVAGGVGSSSAPTAPWWPRPTPVGCAWWPPP